MTFTVLLSLGVVCFVALMLVQYHQEEPLSPVKMMWTSIALIGTLVAMIAGAVFVTFLELVERMHMDVLHQQPFATGVLFAPMIFASLVAAVLFGVLLKTRYMPILILAGVACLIAAGGLILNFGVRGSSTFTLAAAALLGFGAGATVSPGLTVAAFTLASKMVGRVFALVELVRSLSDYVIAPIIMKIARVRSLQPPLDWPGVHHATAITLWLTLGFTVLGIVLWVASEAGLPRPDIKAWIKDDKPAFDSPKLLARLRE